MDKDQMLAEAVALLREWGSPCLPTDSPTPYGERIRLFLERVDGTSTATDRDERVKHG